MRGDPGRRRDARSSAYGRGKRENVAKKRLTTTERNAKDWADNVREVCARQPDYSVRLGLVWRKSRTWGLCPSLETLGGTRLAYASGCGYDKESAALAEGLRFLGATEAEVGQIHGCGGCGLGSITEKLAACGWKLEKTHNGRTEDGFTVSRTAAPTRLDERD